MSILGYLCQREYGPRSRNVNKNKKAVKSWLGNIASTPSSNQPCEFSGEPRATFLVDFSPNRTKVASTHGDHTVRVTDITTGKCTHILTGHPRTPWCLAFHPASNEILASGCLGGEVRIWDLSGGGSEVWKSDNNAVISSLTFHPFDHVLVFASSNTVYFWDWSQPQPFAFCRTTYDYERVRWLRFDKFGHYLFTGICNNTTVHRRPAAEVVHISDDTGRGATGSGQNPNWRQMQVNRQRYQTLVQRFFHYQQERLQLSGRPRGPPSWGEDGEGDRPTSPVHEAALNDARDYARLVTGQSRDRQHAGRRLSGPAPGEYNLYGVNRRGALSPPPRRLDDDAVEPDLPVRQSDDMDRLASELGPGWRITPAPSSLPNQSSGSGSGSDQSSSRISPPLPGSNASEISTQAGQASRLNFMRNTLHRIGVDGSQPPPAGESYFGVATEVAMSGWQSTGSERSWPPSNTRSGTVSAASSAYAANYGPFTSSDPVLPTSAGSRAGTVSQLGCVSHGPSASAQRGSASTGLGSQAGRGVASTDVSTSGPLSQNISSTVTSSANSASVYTQADSTWGGASHGTKLSSFPSRASVTSAPSTSSEVHSASQPAPKRTYSTAFGAAQPNTPATSAGQRLEGIHWLTGAAPTDTRPSSRAVGSHRTSAMRRLARGGRLGLLLHDLAASTQSAQGRGPACDCQSASHLRSCLMGPAGGWSGSRRAPGGNSNTHHNRSSSQACEHGGPGSENCPICGHFNMDLLQTRSSSFSSSNPSLPSLREAAGTAVRRRPWVVSLVPTSSGGLTLSGGAQASDASSARVLRFPSSQRSGSSSRATGDGHHRMQTADGTSQTQGNLNMPEHADQGTDVVGLAQLQRHIDSDDGDETEMNDEAVMSADDQEMVETEPAEATTASEAACTCGRMADPPVGDAAAVSDVGPPSLASQPHPGVFAANQLHVSTAGDLASSSALPQSTLAADTGVLARETDDGRASISAPESSPQASLGPASLVLSGRETALSQAPTRASSVSGLTEHLEQQVSELDRRINVLRDTFNERMRALNEDRRRLLSSLRNRIMHDSSSEERLPSLVDAQNYTLPDPDAGGGNSGQTSRPSVNPSRARSVLSRLGESLMAGLPRPRFLGPQLPRARSESSSLLRSQLSQAGMPCVCSPPSSHSTTVTSTSRTFPSSLPGALTQAQVTSVQSDIFNSTTQARTGLLPGLTAAPRPTLGWSSGSMSASMSTLGSGAGSRNMIEVLGPSGESETITYRELARRMANREDVMVVGDHRLRAPASSSNVQGGEQAPQHPLLETFLRADHPPPPPRRPPRAVPTIRVDRSASQDAPLNEDVVSASDHRMLHEDHRWHALQQRHLHPHYSVSILDETINRPNDALQTAINRAIAGVFMSSGEQAVASNIVPQTHRVQRWDFRQCQIPDLTRSKANIVVEHCKLHNDASIDLSLDATLLATFVPSHRGFPDDNILAVFSLLPESFGQCLFTKSFGPNAISVSLSPDNQFILVGLAAKRLSWVFTPNQLVGQIYRMKEQGAGEMSMKLVTDVLHPCLNEGRPHVSVNSARWLPEIGDGLVYGTNRGDLHFYRTGPPKMLSDEDEERRSQHSSQPDTRPQQQVSSIATQTGTGSIHRTAFTQTSEGEGPC